MIECFGIIVYNCKIDPEYFWYKMTFKELDVLLENYYNDFKNTWNQTRLICYFGGGVDISKTKPNKLLSFIWDEEVDEVDDQEIIEAFIEDFNKRIEEQEPQVLDIASMVLKAGV